jgi:sorbitol/mannitol transport system permease protein
VLPLVVWAFVPLAVTLWFSLLHYNLLDPITRFVGFNNYSFLLTDPSLLDALWNTLALVVGVLAASIVFGCLFAVLFDQEFHGRSVARLLVIMPFLGDAQKLLLHFMKPRRDAVVPFWME